MSEILGLVQPQFDESGNMVIKVNEEPGVLRTGGHYKAKGFSHDFPIGTTEYEFSFPYPISLLAAEFNGKSSNTGDVFDFLIGQDTIIGTIVSSISSNDTIINVDSTTSQNIVVGRYLKLDDGTNSEESCVVGVDENNNLVTLNDPVTNNYNVSSPTFCKMTIKMVENVELDSDVRYELGTSKIGGSYIPAGTKFKIIYTNNGSTAIRFKPIIEFLY